MAFGLDYVSSFFGGDSETAQHDDRILFDRATVQLPTVSPLRVPLPMGPDINVVAFHAPAKGLTEWDLRTGGSPLGNLWPLYPQRLVIEHNGARGTFHTADAAFQALQWWSHEATRRAFEKCDAPGLQGSTDVRMLKAACERTKILEAWRQRDFAGLGQLEAMLMVLRKKWRLPGYKEFLLTTRDCFLIDHCDAPRDDHYWADDWLGGGENRLGAALMVVRDELMSELHGKSCWPDFVMKPTWMYGKFHNNWQEVVDEVARFLVSNCRAMPPMATGAALTKQVGQLSNASEARKKKRINSKAEQSEAKAKPPDSSIIAKLPHSSLALERKEQLRAARATRAMAIIRRAELGRQAIQKVAQLVQDRLQEAAAATAHRAEAKAKAISFHESLTFAAMKIQIWVRRYLKRKEDEREAVREANEKLIERQRLDEERQRLHAAIRVQTMVRGWLLRKRIPLKNPRVDLNVIVVLARGLPKHKPKTGPHPLCICQEHGHARIAFKTRVVRNTQEPCWNHDDKIFGVVGTIEFKVYDTDIRGTQLGKAELSHPEYYPNGFDGELVLKCTDASAKAALKVKVDVANVEAKVEVSKLESPVEVKNEALDAWPNTIRTERRKLKRRAVVV